MKIINYIKQKGISTILHDCGYNLENVRGHLFRECELTKGYDLSRILKTFEDYMRNKPAQPLQKILLQELKIKIKEN